MDTEPTPVAVVWFVVVAVVAVMCCVSCVVCPVMSVCCCVCCVCCVCCFCFGRGLRRTMCMSTPHGVATTVTDTDLHELITCVISSPGTCV